MENKICISNRLVQKTGINVSHCYQCGKCTAGCVLATEMDLAPSYIMRLLQTSQLENDRRILASNAIWICLNCENCVGRCPKEVDIPRVMDFLRELSVKKQCVNRKARKVVAFHSSFLDMVKRTGRLYEIGLVAGYKFRTFHLMQDVSLVPAMLQKGKLGLLPESVKDIRKIKKIFNDTAVKSGKEDKL